MNEFGETLRSRRTAAKLSRSILASRCGVSEREVGFWETGDRVPEPEKQREILEWCEREPTVLDLAHRLKRDVNALIDQFAAAAETRGKPATAVPGLADLEQLTVTPVAAVAAPRARGKHAR